MALPLQGFVKPSAQWLPYAKFLTILIYSWIYRSITGSKRINLTRWGRQLSFQLPCRFRRYRFKPEPRTQIISFLSPLRLAFSYTFLESSTSCLSLHKLSLSSNPEEHDTDSKCLAIWRIWSATSFATIFGQPWTIVIRGADALLNILMICSCTERISKA